VPGDADRNLRRKLARGELVRLLYRLGRQGASGVLTLSPQRSRASALSDAYTSGRAELFVLRRGAVVLPEGELAKRTLIARLARLVAEGELGCVFEGGAASAPPGAQHVLGLASWARTHLEQQLDGSLAESLVRELAGIRLSIRGELAPAPDDEADKRMIAAMAQPRRLDQIWPLARTPRFRLLAFLHFLRSVDGLEVEGIVAEQSAPIRTIDHRRAAALRMLGVPDNADVDTVKRAYRRLARAIHPDLQPEAIGERRRILERRFVEITAAYHALT
jgi:DnaJ-domain-containing protein 1